MKKIKFCILFLLVLLCSYRSSFGQNEPLLFTSWVYTWDSLCDNFPIQDYYGFFPDSVVVNYTIEDNTCSIGKYVLKDSLVFMKFYCNETNFYSNTNLFDTIQYVAIISGDSLMLKGMGYWNKGKYNISSYSIPANYIFKRKYSIY